MQLHLLAALTVTLILAGEDKKEGAGRSDALQLKGRWSVTSTERYGAKQVSPQIWTEWVFQSSGRITLKRNDGELEVSFKLCESKNPKEIDLVGITGRKGVVSTGIYLLSGDTLKICWRQDGNLRPTEFKTESKSNLLMYELKRKKD